MYSYYISDNQFKGYLHGSGLSNQLGGTHSISVETFGVARHSL